MVVYHKKKEKKRYNKHPILIIFVIVISTIEWYVSLLMFGLDLCCLTPLSTIFQLYHGSNFFFVDPEKTTDLSQVADKLNHIMLYTSPWSRFELTTSMVIGTVCIGSCKSNYHAMTAMTATLSLLCGSDIFVSWHWHIDFWRNNLDASCAMKLRS